MSQAAELIAFEELRLAEAEDAGFTELVVRQSRFVFRVAYAILRSPQDAEEVVQETWVKLYRTRAWRGMRDERAFLARTAWRIAVGKLPRVRHQPLDPDSPSGGANPERAAIDADWNAIVHRLIDALPEELRQPLVLSALEEMDSPQVARVMGISEGTVRTRVMRARQILKQKLCRLTSD